MEVAEACKILENTYRAVNIALVNELKVLFARMGLDVWEVIEAAKTKPFTIEPAFLRRVDEVVEQATKAGLQVVLNIHHFDEIIGGSAGFVNCGYGFLVPECSAEGFRRNIALQQSLGIDTRIISRQEFEIALREARYSHKDFQKLLEALDPKGNRQTVSLDKLQEYARSSGQGQGPRMTPNVAIEKYQGFDARTKQIVQKISEYLKKNNIDMTMDEVKATLEPASIVSTYTSLGGTSPKSVKEMLVKMKESFRNFILKLKRSGRVRLKTLTSFASKLRITDPVLILKMSKHY